MKRLTMLRAAESLLNRNSKSSSEGCRTKEPSDLVSTLRLAPRKKNCVTPRSLCDTDRCGSVLRDRHAGERSKPGLTVILPLWRLTVCGVIAVALVIWEWQRSRGLTVWSISVIPHFWLRFYFQRAAFHNSAFYLLYRKQEALLSLRDRATRKPAKDCWNGRGNDNLGWSDLQMYFKVIKRGTSRKLLYYFLLVVYSNFCRITHRLWEIWCETVQWPWNMAKIIDSRVTWKLSCGHVCKMFGKQWMKEAKIAIFNDPTFQRTPREYLHKPYGPTTKNYIPLATFPSLTVYD